MAQANFQLVMKENTNQNLPVGDGINFASGLARWSFSENTPKSFDAHVSKSVPLYVEGHSLICSLLSHFVKDYSTVVEVGCSTGLLTEKIAATCSELGKNNNIPCLHRRMSTACPAL